MCALIDHLYKEKPHPTFLSPFTKYISVVVGGDREEKRNQVKNVVKIILGLVQKTASITICYEKKLNLSSCSSVVLNNTWQKKLKEEKKKGLFIKLKLEMLRAFPESHFHTCLGSLDPISSYLRGFVIMMCDIQY